MFNLKASLIVFAVLATLAALPACESDDPFEVSPAWEDWPTSSVWCGPNGAGPCEVVYTAGDSIPWPPACWTRDACSPASAPGNGASTPPRRRWSATGGAEEDGRWRLLVTGRVPGRRRREFAAAETSTEIPD